MVAKQNSDIHLADRVVFESASVQNSPDVKEKKNRLQGVSLPRVNTAPALTNKQRSPPILEANNSSQTGYLPPVIKDASADNVPVKPLLVVPSKPKLEILTLDEHDYWNPDMPLRTVHSRPTSHDRSRPSSHDRSHPSTHEHSDQSSQGHSHSGSNENSQPGSHEHKRHFLALEGHDHNRSHAHSDILENFSDHTSKAHSTVASMSASPRSNEIHRHSVSHLRHETPSPVPSGSYKIGFHGISPTTPSSINHHWKGNEVETEEEIRKRLLQHAGIEDPLDVSDAAIDNIVHKLKLDNAANQNVHLHHVPIGMGVEKSIEVIGSVELVNTITSLKKTKKITASVLVGPQLDEYLKSNATLAIHRARELVSGNKAFRQRPITKIEKSLFKRFVLISYISYYL